jgi:hypothetical protein
MVDATTLIVISTVAQTLVITFTLIVFILQFRSQEMAIRESSYQGLMGRYNDFISTLAQSPAIGRMMMARFPGGKSGEITAEEASVFGHLLVAYGIIEEAFLLYKKHWIDEDNWLQWSAFLESISGFPEFELLHSGTSGTFDGDFEDYVTKLLSKRSGDKKSVVVKK